MRLLLFSALLLALACQGDPGPSVVHDTAIPTDTAADTTLADTGLSDTGDTATVDTGPPEDTEGGPDVVDTGDSDIGDTSRPDTPDVNVADTVPTDSGSDTAPDTGSSDAGDPDIGPDDDAGHLSTTVDPAGCVERTDDELEAAGFVIPDATPDDGIDDTIALQAALDEAKATRRMVYLRPGVYDVGAERACEHGILCHWNYAHDPNDDGRAGPFDDTDRYVGTHAMFGTMIIGSDCGESRPVLRVATGTDTRTNFSAVAAEPTPVIAFWERPNTGANTPDNSQGGRCWGSGVDGVDIDFQHNPGVVGVRAWCAEGTLLANMRMYSSDARAGNDPDFFAGFYEGVASGGIGAYNIAIEGGRYGDYMSRARGGVSTRVGMQLSGQQRCPIAVSHYAPVVYTAATIEHDSDHPVVCAITGNDAVSPQIGTGASNRGHLVMTHSTIRSTRSPGYLFSTGNRVLGLFEVWVSVPEGSLVVASPAGDLRASTPDRWLHIEEYVAATEIAPIDARATGSSAPNFFNGAASSDYLLDGRQVPRGTPSTLTDNAAIPPELQAQFLIPEYRCNPEGADVVWASAYGAIPGDGLPDHAAIQAALDDSGRVFLPAGEVRVTYADDDPDRITQESPAAYLIRGTLSLHDGSVLCGAGKANTYLNARSWNPSDADAPVFETPDDSDAFVHLSRLRVGLDDMAGRGTVGNYDPHAYGLLLRSGRSELMDTKFGVDSFGHRGDIQIVRVTGHAGGNIVSVSWQDAEEPRCYNDGGDDFGTCTGRNPDEYRPMRRHGDEACLPPLRRSECELVMSPDRRLVRIYDVVDDGQPLRFMQGQMQFGHPPGEGLWEIRNAHGIEIYGVKHESLSRPSKMVAVIRSVRWPGDIGDLLRITDSSNVRVYGVEGLGQHVADRGLIQVDNSTDLRIVAVTRRNGDAEIRMDRWCWVLNGDTCAPAAWTLGLFYLE